VNVTVEHLGPCKKLLRIELEAPAVDAAFDEVIAGYQKGARLPGFRPGKAPRHIVAKAFAKDIEDEAKKKLIGDAYRKAMEEQKLRSVAYPDIEEIEFGRGKALQFAVTVETAPEFELPNYIGLNAQRETGLVTDADVERAINVLREQRGSYADVARPVGSGDFVVVDYAGTCEGKPLTDLAPTAKGLTAKQAFWLHVEPDAFIPGFTTQLIGAQAGETRTVNVDFPADFVTTQLAGKQGVYEVKVVQVKERHLPPLDEAFAKSLGAATVEALTEGVRVDLQNELDFRQRRGVRDQLVRSLLDAAKFELPESMVLHETRNVVYDIVRENQQRGVAKEAIDQQKDEIFSFANNSAKDRVRAGFLLNRIADKEGIKVEEKEILYRIERLAEQNRIPVDKMIKQLRERNGIVEIHEQILTGKVLDFLELHARVTEAVPTLPDAPAAS